MMWKQPWFWWSRWNNHWKPQVVLLTLKVVVMLLAVLNLLVVQPDLAVHRHIMVLLDQPQGRQRRTPWRWWCIWWRWRWILLAAVAVVMKAGTIMAVVEVEDPLVSTANLRYFIFYPRDKTSLYRKSSNFFNSGSGTGSNSSNTGNGGAIVIRLDIIILNN